MDEYDYRLPPQYFDDFTLTRQSDDEIPDWWEEEYEREEDEF